MMSTRMNDDVNKTSRKNNIFADNNIPRSYSFDPFIKITFVPET